MVEDDNLWHGWWRWPLIPVFSTIGALLGSTIFMLLQLLDMKFNGGFSESSWYYLYVLPLLRDSIFGFLFVYFGCLAAPRGKLIVGVILATFTSILLLIVIVFNIQGIPEVSNFGILSGLATTAGAIYGIIQGSK